MSLPISRNLVSYVTEGALIGFTVCAGVALVVNRVYHGTTNGGEHLLDFSRLAINESAPFVISAGLIGGFLGVVAGVVSYTLFAKNDRARDRFSHEQYV